jgi:zinc transporter ZupT
VKAGSIVLMPILGIGFHSFVDGVIYSITFVAEIFTGALTALGMVLHEFPEGIIAFVHLQQGGYG